MRARGSSQTAGLPLPSRLVVRRPLSMRTADGDSAGQGPGPTRLGRSPMAVRAHVREKMALDRRFFGRALGTQPDATRRKVWQAGGSRSDDVGFGGGEMALEALEKPPFGAIFRQFSYGFHRVFRRPGPKARKLARIQPRKALVLGHVPLRTCPLRSLAGYHSLPIQGGGQPGPRADNRESGQSEARWALALACQ